MKYYKIILFLCIISSCSNINNAILDQYQFWEQREIIIPDNIVFTKDIFDTINIEYKEKYKILTYIDSVGCLNCNLSLGKWNKFIPTLDSLTNNRVNVIHIVNIKSASKLKEVILGSKYHYPVCIDLNDSINKLNHFSTDYNFRCFLLDENNHVVLIGNPVLNPKIKELYIRTICERLGIEQPTETSEPLRITNNLGVFDWRKEQQTTFVVRNSQNDDMSIDSLYSSCECTTATIDKTLIAKGDSAIVTVTYKAEKAEPFMREVYVHSANNQELTLAIEGEGIE